MIAEVSARIGCDRPGSQIGRRVAAAPSATVLIGVVPDSTTIVVAMSVAGAGR
ncbi:hypothetical protein ACFU44_18315 [Nocardia rhizosphaerihabitans]|uniref:hypothetical protein n=1 Tax=Nocardia rhizosphaerihabitans TaxID=1691570 RepID=UPI0036714A9A